MHYIPMLLLTVATLAAAVYTHYRLPFHSGTPKQLWISRAILVLIGAAFGWVNVQIYAAEPSLQILVFLSAFGVVHVPAAFILFIKRQRREWK